MSPTVPVVGVTVISGVVTRNVSARVRLEEATSSPTTVYAPADSLGTRNVHANAWANKGWSLRWSKTTEPLCGGGVRPADFGSS